MFLDTARNTQTGGLETMLDNCHLTSLLQHLEDMEGMGDMDIGHLVCMEDQDMGLMVKRTHSLLDKLR